MKQKNARNRVCKCTNKYVLQLLTLFLAHAAIDASMCTDDPCIRTRCAGEVGAFEGCFASSQMSEPACQRELRTCLGSDYPQVRCVVMR